jgi:hypothetical protein
VHSDAAAGLTWRFARLPRLGRRRKSEKRVHDKTVRSLARLCPVRNGNAGRSDRSARGLNLDPLYAPPNYGTGLDADFAQLDSAPEPRALL